MNIDTSIVEALLSNYTSQPTGYNSGDTITYGALAPEFLYQKLGRPDANDTNKYPLGAADPGYQIDMGKWTKAYGQDESFAAASAAQMAMVRKAFDAWEKVLNVKFVQVDGDVAQIRIGVGDLSTMKPSSGVTVGGYEKRPDSGNTGNPLTDFNLIVIDKSSDTGGNGAGWAPGGRGFVKLMHEIGHALGLEHPADYDLGLTGGIHDNQVDTIMSYYPDRSYDETLDGYGSLLQSPLAGNYTLTPARYDIYALQKRLGVNSSTSGNGTRFEDFTEKTEYRTLFDARGNDDVIDASKITTPVKINLEPGTASSIGSSFKNIVIAFETIIENAIGGTQSDILIGNDVANELDGRAGNDTLKGGKGVDTYIIGEGTDTIVDSAGDGKILVGTYELKGSTKAQVCDAKLKTQGISSWKDDGRSDLFYVLKTGSLDDGTLEIARRESNGYKAIGIIEHFKNGQLGITLKNECKLSVQKQTAANPYTPDNADQPPSTQPLNLAENLGQGLKVFLNTAAKAGDTITLALSALGDKFKAVLGDDVVGFDSGNVTLTLAEGQTEIAFSFLSTGDVDIDQQLTLTAKLQPADGGDAVENTLSINFDATDEAQDAQTGTTIIENDLALGIAGTEDKLTPWVRLLRSTGKKGEKRNVWAPVGDELVNASDVVANDIQWRIAA